MKKGSIVKLKSGGPDMIIVRFIGDSDEMAQSLSDFTHRKRGFKDGDAICQWFDKTDLKAEVFSIQNITMVAE